jgi:hypothetical protein
MNLPRPTDRLAGCVWLPRIVAKARLLAEGALPGDYESRFCHASGVDGQFLAFFGLSRDNIVRSATLSDHEITLWFQSLPLAANGGIEKWNAIAVNLGRPGFPMAERLPIALPTTYKHLAHLKPETVFAALEADEKTD